MLNNGKPLKKLTRLASCALCCFAAAAAAANPPTGNNGGGLLARATGQLMGASPSRTPASRVGFQNLDLRPPETLPGARAPGPIGESSAAAFPSAKHGQSGAPSGTDEDSPGGRDWAGLRMQNRLQEMAHRVSHEGLPVARLWETKTALLHVGLNAKGKPGLWLIQKVP
jgi:hypothetical protein